LYQSDLTSIQDDITSSTYNLLSRVHTWPAFSNHTAGDGGSASNSLEAIHDEIHGYVGGQMGDPAVAGNFLCNGKFLGNL
jgi:tyrosinase